MRRAPNHSTIDCHSALVNVKDKSGKYIYAGRKLTGFSNEEEDGVDKTKYVPFKLEDKVCSGPSFGSQTINGLVCAGLCSWPHWERTSAAALGAPVLLSMELSLLVKTPQVRKGLEGLSSMLFRNFPNKRLSQKSNHPCFAWDENSNIKMFKPHPVWCFGH